MHNQALVVSYISLWALTLTCLVAVYALYRHVSRELRDVYRIPAPGDGPELSKPIEPSTYIALDGTPRCVGGASGRTQLVLFVAVGCSDCFVLMKALPALMERRKSQVDVILFCGGGSEAIRASTSQVPADVWVLPVPISVPRRMYRVTVRPYALLVDPSGILRAKGTPEPSLASLESMIDRAGAPN